MPRSLEDSWVRPPLRLPEPDVLSRFLAPLRRAQGCRHQRVGSLEVSDARRGLDHCAHAAFLGNVPLAPGSARRRPCRSIRGDGRSSGRRSFDPVPTLTVMLSVADSSKIRHTERGSRRRAVLLLVWQWVGRSQGRQERYRSVARSAYEVLDLSKYGLSSHTQKMCHRRGYECIKSCTAPVCLAHRRD